MSLSRDDLIQLIEESSDLEIKKSPLMGQFIDIINKESGIPELPEGKVSSFGVKTALAQYIGHPHVVSDDKLIQHVNRSILWASCGISRLPRELLLANGMSSPKIRHMINNICEYPDTVYMEVGTWRGVTSSCALYQNSIPSILMDTFSEFTEVWGEDMPPIVSTPLLAQAPELMRYHLLPKVSPFEEFYRNISKYATIPPQVYKGDCFEITVEKPKNPVTVFYYDAEHDYEHQYKAFVHFDELIADRFIAIVDDFNSIPVQEGTRDAFEHLGYVVEQEWIKESNGPGDVFEWWNGMLIAVVRKS